MPARTIWITGAATFRQIHSRATGFEDLFQAQDTPLAQLPGFLNSQHFVGFDQLAGAVSIGNGNYDGDNDVDGADFLKWQRDLGTIVVTPGDGADGNGNGIVDAADLNIWEGTYGLDLSPLSANSATVPEPSTLLLAGLAGVLIVRRRRRV
jgi:hypothetical protein